MTWLQKIREKGTDTSGRTNIVIVPGNYGETLADQTCSHFPTWLDDIVESENKSTVVWIFRHDIRIDSLASWFAYCEAGEHLLKNLTSMQKEDGLSDDDTLILIGHKLGSLMLKKALLEAHRNSHHTHMDALLNTIEILVMVGDPDLNPDNQHEWISSISKCLPCMTLPKHLDCPQDARCLQHVAGCFEEFTIHSSLFQVSCAAESKRRHFLKFRAEDPRCICSATMTVRMWTTTNEEVTVSPGDGDKKNCAFYPKSTLYHRLLSIPNFTGQSSISGTRAPLAVLEGQTSDGPSTFSPVDQPVTELIHNEPASPPAPLLTISSIPASDTVSVTTIELASGSDILSVSSIVDETNIIEDGDLYSHLGRTPPDSLAADVNSRPEDSPYYDVDIESLKMISFEEAINADSVNNTVQQNFPHASSALEPPRAARQFLFLSMRVPSRDPKFFGREEILRPLEAILTPASMPSSTSLASLGSAAVIVLHGLPGVGKSAIALELTYRTQATFHHIFWLRANSILHLAQSFHEAAVSLGLVQDRRDHNHESSRQKFISWLSTTSSKWLLVFDDADEIQSLLHFVPKRRGGSIIVTSRQTLRAGLDIEDDEGLHTFQVDPFRVEDATEFIRSLAPCAIDAADVAGLTTIADNCGCLPLTLRRVGTIIERRGSIKDKQIMPILEQHASRVLASQPSSPLTRAELSSASFALANVITFLDPYCIDDAILLGAQRYKEVPMKAFPMKAFPMKDDDYFDAKNELIAQTMLTVNADASGNIIHRVTARSYRAMLDPDNFREGFQLACQLLEARWPSRRKMRNIILGNWPEFDALHSHVHELSSIFVEYDRKRKRLNFKQQELSNDSYLKLLLLSTWYNACRGNAEEDQVLIRLAHGLIAKSQRPDPRLLQTETSSTILPASLIDVGLDDAQSPRLVNTSGQTGCYVALSHCWGSRNSSEIKLTNSNMNESQQSIEPSDIPRCVFDAINLTRSLGVRYLWTDSLCVVQGDQDHLSKMIDIYRSAVLTIVACDTYDGTIGSCINSSVLGQPFLIFLDWSRPVVAKSFSDRLLAPNAFCQRWTIQEKFLARQYLHHLPFIFKRVRKRKMKAAHYPVAATRTDESGTRLEDMLDSDRLNEAGPGVLEVENTDARFSEACCEIDQGVHHVEAGKNFEALALFMKAKDLVSAFRTLTPRSWKIHAVASANIALIYRMQHLPTLALDIAEASLTIQGRLRRLYKGECNHTLERIQLHFVIGGIHNALGNPEKSLDYYKLASTELEKLPDEQISPESTDWKGVLDLKLAQHHLRRKDYKEAHILLQQSLELFQSQETLSAQAHLARTLHWQSIAYEAQGSKIMGNAIKAAARQTWIGVREARGAAGSEGMGTTSLSTAEFDGEVEFWYR